MPTPTSMSFEEWCLLVKHHDLTYGYSDDNSVYQRGQAVYNLIVDASAQFPRADVVRIWNARVDSFLIPEARPQFYWQAPDMSHSESKGDGDGSVS
jgi:hypothetical protein